MQFDTLLVRKDTVELNFVFLYRDTLPCNRNLITDPVVWGAVYKKGNDSILFYSNAGTARYIKHTCDDFGKCPDRFVKPLQPEVIDYIKANRTRLNSWFREEAKRRGIIE